MAALLMAATVGFVFPIAAAFLTDSDPALETFSSSVSLPLGAASGALLTAIVAAFPRGLQRLAARQRERRERRRKRAGRATPTRPAR